MKAPVYFATYDDQLATWFAGHPEHHGEHGSARSRCVPDFSCCRPEMLSPPEERLRFIEGSKEDRLDMDEVFMRRLMASVIPLLGSEGVRH
jgi:hypothetical protein